MITLTLLHPIKSTPIQSWKFDNESVIRIGRATDNNVVLYSAVVSRHHVELRRVGLQWKIINLGTNGTYLKGSPITQVTAEDGVIFSLARSGPQIQIHLAKSKSKVSADSQKLPSDIPVPETDADTVTAEDVTKPIPLPQTSLEPEVGKKGYRS
ncbi:FHA domain-containing protein [Oscillatoria acuminata]|uniref:FHA domain-containing protein n=1 Tax=Oscillatoria acuminata PCC 6304 TaxID=56110 RepID=K9TQ64_9CYAN|nr:FHA domain-containing protein [Oscillatoria acuminata]AFY84271.1 FHA domain-containing protein [Oscillatoria acuminata PCC 6304]